MSFDGIIFRESESRRSVFPRGTTEAPSSWNEVCCSLPGTAECVLESGVGRTQPTCAGQAPDSLLGDPRAFSANVRWLSPSQH